MGNLRLFFQIIYFAKLISANSRKTIFDEDIYELTNEIYENYFQVFRCVTFAADDVRNVQYLLKTLPMFVVNLSTGESLEQGLFTEAFEQGCGAIIVQTNAENRPAMVQALVDAKKEAVSYRYNQQRYLFLPVSENDTQTDVFLNDRMFFLPNFVLINPDDPGGRFVIRGHTVFDARKTEPMEVLDTWSNSGGFQRGSDLYRDKIKDIGGKQLVFGLINYTPYALILQEGNKTIYDGIETRVAAQFVETINGTFDGLDHPVEMWGDKFPNGSGTGIYGSVQRHRADLGFAAIYQWYCDLLDCSYPYLLSYVTCLTPRPGILPSWMTILLPFTTTTWIALSVAFVCSCFFAVVIGMAMRRKKDGKTSDHIISSTFQSAFDLFRLQMQQIPNISTMNHPLGTYFRVTLVYYFAVSLFWQGGISSILTVPRYEDPIDTAADLVSSWPRVKWGANHGAWTFSIENSTDPYLREIVKKFVILDVDTLVKKARTRDFAYFFEKLPSNHYGFNEYINEDTVPYLRLMKSYVYTAYVVFTLPRGSPYTEKLDHMIHWLFDTGMTQKMELQVSLERINNHLQNMIRFSNDKEIGTVILTVSHIQGPLYIYVGGVFISTMAFILEKTFPPKKKIKKKWCHPGFAVMQVKAAESSESDLFSIS